MENEVVVDGGTFITRRYRVYVEGGAQTPVPRYYIYDGVDWYFNDIASTWTRCPAGTVVRVDSDLTMIITTVGRAYQIDQVRVNRNDLPK